MSKTNCINCGAAKDIDEIKCPFCGTTYLDLTAIDFSSHNPVVCKFVLPYSNDRMIMSMLAIPHLNEIKAEATYCHFDDGCSTRLTAIENWDVNVGVSFTPISRQSMLFSIRNEGR